MKKYCVEYTNSPEHYLFTGEWNQDEAYVEAETVDEAVELKKAWLVDHDIDPDGFVFRVTDVTEVWQ